jgi:hypothetical protein
MCAVIKLYKEKKREEENGERKKVEWGAGRERQCSFNMSSWY